MVPGWRSLAHLHVRARCGAGKPFGVPFQNRIFQFPRDSHSPMMLYCRSSKAHGKWRCMMTHYFFAFVYPASHFGATSEIVCDVLLRFRRHTGRIAPFKHSDPSWRECSSPSSNGSARLKTLAAIIRRSTHVSVASSACLHGRDIHNSNSKNSQPCRLSGYDT